MSKSFFNFGDEEVEDEKPNIKNDEGSGSKENIEDMVGKYKNMSKGDLMSTFFQEAQKQKQNGTLDVGKLEKTIDGMGSYLTAEQKKNIKELLNKIKW